MPVRKRNKLCVRQYSLGEIITLASKNPYAAEVLYSLGATNFKVFLKK
jgi:hypothetical protein